MPLPFFLSTSGVNAYFGMAYTRMKGVILSGTIGSTMAGPIEAPGGVALIQPALVCSTAGQAAQMLSTAKAAVSAANFIYITQTTGPISVSASTAGDSAPPMSGMGAAISWDSANRRFMVWSSAHDWVTQTSTVGGGYFTSS